MDAERPADLDRNDGALKTVNITCEVLYSIGDLGSATVAAIAQDIGYSKSTVYDHVQTLMANNLVIRYNDGNPTCLENPPEYPTYELSFAFLEMIDRIARQHRPMGTVERQLERLAQTTGDLAHFAIPEYNATVYLARERGVDAIDLGLTPGTRDPLWTTAFGKAVLSHYDEADVRDPRFLGDGAIESLDAFAERVAEARDRGYAIDDEETREDVRAVAAPVVAGGRVLGAIGVSGPASRFTEEAVESRLSNAVCSAAETIRIRSRLQ
jgi:DNA-binding IclR family transcriptional regulator